MTDEASTTGTLGAGLAGVEFRARPDRIGRVITQSGSQPTADVQGGAGTAIGLATGKTTFSGTVSADSFDLGMAGTRVVSSGTCADTVNAELTGVLAATPFRARSSKAAKCGCRNSALQRLLPDSRARAD